jgi:hypothetical protein
VRTCIETATFSVLINGQPYGPFEAQRGIRQGCPLSPYLFVLAINELSICLQQALQDNHLSGIKLGPDSPPIHSLLFADDLINCGTAEMQQITHMADILQNFCNASGQTPNWSKSNILFSKHVDQIIRDSIKSVFPVQDLQPNTIHLGHPIIINHSDKNQAYNFIYNKFKSKLTVLKAHSLNHAGRITYIQSVFASIPIYYMAHVLFTKKFLAKITSIIRTFWWAGVQEECGTHPFHFELGMTYACLRT